jgi:hypothetical protein
MRILVLLVSLIVFLGLTGCSSSTPSSDSGTEKGIGENYPPPKILAEKAIKPFKPAKAMKCTYDTDCVVPDSCAAGKCKLTGNECRFRSDCPSPRGTCVNKKCEFP